MKNSIFSIMAFVLFLGLASCRGGSEKAPESTPQQTEEINRLDSLSNELESTTESIEKQTETLKAVLEAL